MHTPITINLIVFTINCKGMYCAIRIQQHLCAVIKVSLNPGELGALVFSFTEAESNGCHGGLGLFLSSVPTPLLFLS